MRAIVLAAGAGGRLWPYTVTRPKPMVPVAGKPILGWLLEAIAEAGITQVQIVVGYKASRIQTAFQDGKELGLDISYVRQEVLLGSGAALATALDDGGVPDEAIVLGGDNIVDAALLDALLEAGPNRLAVARTGEPSKYGVVRLEGDRVAHIEEKPPITGDALVSTGVACLGAKVLERVPALVDQGQLGMAHILERVATQGPGLEAVIDAGRWLDAVYPWDLLSLDERLVETHGRRISDRADVADGAILQGPVVVGPGATIEEGAIVRGPTSIGPNARIRSGAIVSASLVMEDAVVGPGSLVERAVVGDGTRIHGGATLARGNGCGETKETVHRLQDIGPMVGEGCTIEGGGLVHPAAILGNNVRVTAGARARGRIPEGGSVS